jgi:hydroxyacylglutathione hydrolase
MLEIHQIPVLTDNYIYLIHEPASRSTAAVDPAVAGPVLTALDRRAWTLTHILNTHHHGDHVGGNRELKARTGCLVVGPLADRDRIPGIDVAVGEGDHFKLGQAEARIFDVPGHTRGHIAYWFPESGALFCGDTLFAMGCGRLFEGTPEQMWHSLGKLKALPPSTRVYCAHEYTQANGRFALTVEPDNRALRERMASVSELRRRGLPTVPSTLAEELATNPFLRPSSPSLQRTLHLPAATEVEVFAETRRRKDRFAG